MARKKCPRVPSWVRVGGSSRYLGMQCPNVGGVNAKGCSLNISLTIPHLLFPGDLRKWECDQIIHCWLRIHFPGHWSSCQGWCYSTPVLKSDLTRKRSFGIPRNILTWTPVSSNMGARSIIKPARSTLTLPAMIAKEGSAHSTKLFFISMNWTTITV